jgi:hypothetical protein
VAAVEADDFRIARPSGVRIAQAAQFADPHIGHDGVDHRADGPCHASAQRAGFRPLDALADVRQRAV